MPFETLQPIHNRFVSQLRTIIELLLNGALNEKIPELYSGRCRVS